MIVELHHNDGKSEFPEICCTELTAPSVIFDRDTGKFFFKTPCDPRICTTVAKYLLYRECRGEVLNSIKVVRPLDSEDVA
ncbi:MULTISPECIES: hypothetical protein [unclassified Microcoleus]|uniref:hypothetical protein n=1 Tax=unclassified Microcoleus TaxID=2642155 RepID=UPI002FCEC9FC